MSGEGQFMPVWLYNFISASVVVDYMMEDRPLPAAASKYVRHYANKYSTVELPALVNAAEEIIMFVAGLNVDDPLGLIDFYRFYCLNFETPQKKRKRDSLFGDIFEAKTSKGYGYDMATKSFKAYTFSLRSNQVPMPDEHWELGLETGEEGQVDALVKLTQAALEDADYQYAAENGMDGGGGDAGGEGGGGEGEAEA